VELVGEIKKGREYSTNVRDKESAHNLKGKSEEKVSLHRSSVCLFFSLLSRFSEYQ
jgi:hypothetical protein